MSQQAIDHIEAEAIQILRAYECYLISAKLHAEKRERELTNLLKNWNNGEKSKVEVAKVLAKVKLWFKYCYDEHLAKLIKFADYLGILRWYYRNKRVPAVREHLLEFTQEVKKELSVLRENTALALSGEIFKIEEFAEKLMKDRKLLEQEEEKMRIERELNEFRERLDLESDVKEILEEVGKSVEEG